VSSIETAATITEAKNIIQRHKPNLIASALHFVDGGETD
jgi:two-component system chemotaxis response regulator CheY